MNPYQPPETTPEPRDAIDKYVWGLAIAAPFIIAFLFAIAVAALVVTISVGRLFVPQDRAAPIPSEAEQDRMYEPRNL